ncbi:MAG: helix-turn-helix domain-containing protein [bacterium]
MKTILVVDPEPGTEHITKVLLGDHYQLLFSRYIKHAVALTKKTTASMAIYDYTPPITKTTKFIENIKQHNAKTKIVLTSNQSETLIPISFLNWHIDHYLEKPWNLFTFRPQVDRILFCDRNDPLDQALACIQKHIQLPMFRVTDIADTINITHQSIDINFKSNLGCTPKEYIVNLRMNLAKYFLQTDHVPVKEIAFETGYQSYEVFAKQFHARVGKSPTAYRESYFI